MLHTRLLRLRILLLVMLLQVLVFNHMHIFGYATPMVVGMYLLYVPYSANRLYTMLASFLIGLVADVFAGTPGACAGAMVAAAMVQHPLLHFMADKDCVEDDVPDAQMLGKMGLVTYRVLIMATYVLTFFVLEYFTFFRITDMLISAGTSLALSLVLVLAMSAVRIRRKE